MWSFISEVNVGDGDDSRVSEPIASSIGLTIYRYSFYAHATTFNAN